MAEKNHIPVHAMTLDIGLRVFPDFQILDLSAGAQARRPCPRRDDPAEQYVNVRRQEKIAYSRKLADSSPSRLHNGGKLHRAVNVSTPAWRVFW
jgi:hypothetical protein